MASIGGETVLILGAAPQPAAQTAENITRRGVNGTALRTLGTQAEPVYLRSVSEHSDAAAVKTAIETFRAMRNTLVTIVDDLDNTWNNQRVVNCQVRRQQKIGTPAGFTGPYLLTMEWIVQDMDTAS